VTSVEGMAASLTERELVRSLREGDEHAFVYLLERYHASLVRLARTFVQDPVWAEEVTRDTWLGVLRGLGTFRGDVSLRMWIHRVLIDTARTRVVRENRSLPFSTLDTAEGEDVVGSDRFLADGRWASPPRSWRSFSEENPLARETLACIRDAIAALPPVQRRVITLRDVEGWPAEEVCTLLDLPDTHQRALLHRARSKVRAALEWHLEAA
jgi:RNA polymerase sigma-70 factor (ECF subfamily)